jgi:hypothetical protein
MESNTGALQQGSNDAAQGRGPANTTGMSAALADAYHAGFNNK